MNLRELYLGENRIVDVTPLASLSNLKVLVLRRNQIENITPIAGLTELVELDIGANQISDVTPLAGLPKIKWLRIEGNRVADIEPLVANAGISEGDTIYLGGNPLNDISINTYIPQLQARGVEVIGDLPPFVGLLMGTVIAYVKRRSARAPMRAW